MTTNGWLQLGLYMVVLLGLAKPLGTFMAKIYAGEPTWLGRLLGPVERLCYRVMRVDPDDEMDWKQYLEFPAVPSQYLGGLPAARAQARFASPAHMARFHPPSPSTLPQASRPTPTGRPRRRMTMSYLSRDAGAHRAELRFRGSGMAVIALITACPSLHAHHRRLLG
jgi:K+-transporting ATPase ATPase A chain